MGGREDWVPEETMILKEQELFERARAVLGVKPGNVADELRYAFYRRIQEHHPDRNPGDPAAHEKAALINEAFGFLAGRTNHVLLLRDDLLVEAVTRGQSRKLEDILSYEDWIKQRFYDVERKSIHAC